MYYYTYRITNKVLNKHYYGVRKSKVHPVNDIGIIYFSSSTDEDFKQDQKLNPQNYKYKVVKIYDTYEESMKGERDLLVRFNAVSSPNFYNKCITSINFATPNYVSAFDIKYGKHKRIHKDEYFQNRDRYEILGVGSGRTLTVTFNKTGEIGSVESHLFDDTLHTLYRTNTTTVFRDGKWIVVDLKDYNPSTDITPRHNTVAVYDSFDKQTKLISTLEYKDNKDRYTMQTSLQIQMRKGDEVINISKSDKELYESMGYKHMNSGRSNCINLLTGDIYKEYTDVMSNYTYLCSSKPTNVLYKFNNVIYNKKDLDKLLLNDYNISLYKALKDSKYQITKMFISDMINKYNKEQYYNKG